MFNYYPTPFIHHLHQRRLETTKVMFLSLLWNGFLVLMNQGIPRARCLDQCLRFSAVQYDMMLY